jgi:uncharacterized membrane protein
MSTASSPALPLIEAGVLAVALLLALAFKPWQVLRHKPLQSPWLAAMVLLPWAWWTQKLLPSGMALHISGACLLVLMFGWPMAVIMLLPICVLAALIDVYGPQQLGRIAVASHELPHWSSAGGLLQGKLDAIVSQMLWMGLAPATLALLLGLLMRRWLPQHLFVYILGRGFVATALAITLSGALALAAGRLPPGLDATEWMLGHWLLGWGEAISTGMLTAIFVAFKPHWMLTYSDVRYLPGPQPKA